MEGWVPTITVRLDDDTRDALQLRADDNGVTVSDFVRGLIREQVVDLRDDDRVEGYAPDTLTPKDRHVLSLLHRILARVLPAEANDVDGDLEYQLERGRVLEEGFTQEYWTEFAGISSELSKRDSQRVMDILDMFRIANASILQLEEDGTPVDADVVRGLRYQGFDFNDPLEHKMASYVKFLIEDDRWNEQAEFVNGPTAGNSHSRVLEMYLRLLAEYRRIRARRRPGPGRDSYLLTADDLQAIAAQSIHPDNR